MRKLILLFLFSILCYHATNAQTMNGSHPQFPQSGINATGKNFNVPFVADPKRSVETSPSRSTFQCIRKMEEVKKTDWTKFTHKNSEAKVLDTVYVGLVPHDTLLITGTYTHNGPIYVFNDGVLIFYHANASNSGDLILFQHGTVIGDSSSLTFPQTYFYQRSIIAVQHSTAYFNSCSFNYSGIQHNLVIGDSAQVGFENVHQADWTTAGLFGYGSVWIHGLNLGGEYILSDHSSSYFNNVDTLLLWHQLPNTAVLNYSFPNGASVMGYQFNNTVPGISGINYQTAADSCHNVWWGLMPVNGSDVTVSNSTIRAIGTWFQDGDSTTVNGVYDDSLYANTVVPFTDRNIHLINTYVQTWSLYAFDSSIVNVYNSAVGEVGTENTSKIISQQFLLDGSGGYFWATDTSAVFATNMIDYSTARSERYGLFVLAYSYLPFYTASSVHNSLFVSVQNTLPVDPIPYDASTMWLENIETASIAHADSLIPVKGSEWIDQGPAGGYWNYGRYSLYYQLQGTSSWIPIVLDSVQEIHHNTLGIWNTNGLVSGTYIFRLLVRDNVGDSVEDFKAITLLPAIITGINSPDGPVLLSIYPNPVKDEFTITNDKNLVPVSIKIYNAVGQLIFNKITSENSISVHELPPGIYSVEIDFGNDRRARKKLVKI